MGVVYTVAWSEDADPAMISRLPSASGSFRGSWLMIGVRLQRLLAAVERVGGRTSDLLVSPWTDERDIASQFALAHGLPGQMGFELSEAVSGASVSSPDFGGSVTIVEVDHLAGARVRVAPLAIDKGWVALVADVAPVTRVLAVPKRVAAVATAYMLGGDCRRTRTESLLVVAEQARASFGAFAAALGQRKSSRGLTDPQARAARLGELLEIQSAVPCASLREFIVVADRATLSVQPATWIH